MKSQIHRRLKNLTAMIGSGQIRGYTLEELCWEYWRVNQRGFLALANGDCPNLRVFVDLFQRRDGASREESDDEDCCEATTAY